MSLGVVGIILFFGVAHIMFWAGDHPPVLGLDCLFVGDIKSFVVNDTCKDIIKKIIDLEKKHYSFN